MSLEKSYLAVVIRLALTVFVFSLILFLPAGTVFWLEGWIYMIILSIFMTVNLLYLKEKDPDLLKKRTSQKFVEGWDKILSLLMAIFLIVMFILPGLDAVRFQWSQVPDILKIIGLIGVALSLFWILLVTKENTFLSRVVEIQEERGHNVITTGPYKVVRHPMYFGGAIWIVSHCFALGSFYSLIPTGILIIIMIIRTNLEDKLLHKQLKGYREYANKTRYRLIPGIW